MSNHPATDSVGENATKFLQTYTSRHPKTLVVYAKWYGKVSGIITDVDLINVDRKGMNLRCILKDGEETGVHIPINPPLQSYGDARPRLLEMKALAEEGLGIAKPPQVTQFYFPFIAIISISAVVFSALAIHKPSAVPRPIYFIVTLGGLIESCLKEVLYFGIFLHVPEAMYAAHLSRKHQMRRGLAIAYIITTFIFGATIWLNLKSKVRTLRRKSAMKAE